MCTLFSIAQFPTAQETHFETEFSKVRVEFNTLFSYTEKFRYSCSIFKDGKRSIANCIGFGNILIYDVDNDTENILPLGTAVEMFNEVESLVVTTKSHEIEKNGKVADRFRIVISVDEDISVSVDDYSEYYIHVAEILGIAEFIDHSCKDAARMYQPNPNQEVYYSQSEVVLSEKQLRISFEEKKFLDNSSREILIDEAIPEYSGSKTDYLRSILKTTSLLELLNYDEKFVKGNRNQYLYSSGRYLLDNQLSKNEVRNTLEWMNSLRNSLKESELNSTIMRSLKL